MNVIESNWNVVAHSDAWEGKWRGNRQMEWVASTLHTTSEHGVSSITTITTADAHTSAASSQLNWHPCQLKWTRPFRLKTKSDFCTCAITFQTQSTIGDNKKAVIYFVKIQCVHKVLFLFKYLVHDSRNRTLWTFCIWISVKWLGRYRCRYTMALLIHCFLPVLFILQCCQ
jgi:hypothetical protein